MHTVQSHSKTDRRKRPGRRHITSEASISHTAQRSAGPMHTTGAYTAYARRPTTAARGARSAHTPSAFRRCARGHRARRRRPHSVATHRHATSTPPPDHASSAPRRPPRRRCRPARRPTSRAPRVPSKYLTCQCSTRTGGGQPRRKYPPADVRPTAGRTPRAVRTHGRRKREYTLQHAPQRAVAVHSSQPAVATQAEQRFAPLQRSHGRAYGLAAGGTRAARGRGVADMNFSACRRRGRGPSLRTSIQHNQRQGLSRSTTRE